MYYIIIREARTNDTPAISEVVRNAYISLVGNSWVNALFSEVTSQMIVLLSAFLFIVMGVPLIYCLISVPLVLVIIYLVIYGAFLMKSAQVMYEKRAEKCWVAESYEPAFANINPKNCWHKIIREEVMDKEAIKLDGYRRKIVGTVAVMKHHLRDNWGWLFRLAVEKQYRRKGIGLQLCRIVQDWCRKNQVDILELAMSECQEGARQLFNEAGFQVKQLYHKKLFTSAFSLQMSQLSCEVRPNFDSTY